LIAVFKADEFEVELVQGGVTVDVTDSELLRFVSKFTGVLWDVTISLIHIEHCLEDYLASILLFNEVSDVGTLLKHHLFPSTDTSLETVCISLLT